MLSQLVPADGIPVSGLPSFAVKKCNYTYNYHISHAALNLFVAQIKQTCQEMALELSYQVASNESCKSALGLYCQNNRNNRNIT